jgi:hypothetical protein
VRSNRSALGARITVTVDAASGHRSVFRQVSSGGSFGASPLEQHIGLGRDAAKVTVDVWWPASNTRQHFANVAKNRVYRIEELSASMVPIERKALRLGGPRRSE